MFLQHDSPPDVTTLFLPGLSLNEVRTARDHVSSALRSEDPWSRDTAVLLTSELATNALVHGDAPNVACPDTARLTLTRPFHVTVGLLDARIHVLVCGAGSTSCTVAPASSCGPRSDPFSETGRGLVWVEAMSQRWGTYGDAASRTVWFMVGRPTPQRPGADR